MIRALITALLVTGASTQYLHVPLDATLGYAFVICVGGWYLWPLLRRPLRMLTRFLLRRLRPRRTSRAVASRPAPAHTNTAPHDIPAQITQINHHHHHYNGLPPHQAAPLRPDYTLTALPRRTEGRIASDEILDGIIDDDRTR